MVTNNLSFLTLPKRNEDNKLDITVDSDKDDILYLPEGNENINESLYNFNLEIHGSLG